MNPSSVFKTSSEIEAEMIKFQLQENNIEAQIIADAGSFSVTVEQPNKDKAAGIISEWEKSEDQTKTNTRRPSSKLFSPIISFLAFLLGAGFVYWKYHSVIHPPEKNDNNFDSVADEFFYYDDDKVLVRLELDKNFDGNIDTIYYYNSLGQTSHAKLDIDFDGSFEEQIEFTHNNVAMVTIDYDLDGNPDSIGHYKSGNMVELEIFGTELEPGHKRLFYDAHEKLVSSEFDADGDGVFEQSTKYDHFENPL